MSRETREEIIAIVGNVAIWVAVMAVGFLGAAAR